MVGNPLKADKATTMKERMTYARVLVEVPINMAFPDTVMFENEYGQIVEQEVEFEWKLILCTKCKNYGHELKECRKQIREELSSKVQEQREETKQSDRKDRNGEQTGNNNKEEGKEITEEKFQQRAGKQVMMRQRQEKNYYRRGYEKRGIVIREPQIDIGNSFAALEDQNNKNDGIAKSFCPGECEADKGPEQGKGGEKPNPNG